MNDTQFKENRQLIKKRLSDKQRMPFEQLVDRNIHYGLDDEFHEQKSLQHIKKELQLNRRLLHRPQPSDIAYDSDLPNDLKKADSQYQKLYEYRDPIDNISTDQNQNINIKPEINKPSVDNPLDWKFGQRSTAKELETRGIIPEQFSDVVHGNKSLDDAKQDWEDSRKRSSNKIKNKIDLKFRPTKQDLQDRGIVPNWENPNFSKEMKQQNVKSLNMKLKQRMDPNEADQRAIINKEQLFSNKDYEEHRKEQKEANKQLKMKMKESLNQRSDKNEIVFRGIVPKEYLYNDVDIAKNKLKQQRISVKEQMNIAFGNRIANKNEIEKLYLREMNESGDVLIDIDELKKQIQQLKEINKKNKIDWEKQKLNYENQINKYKNQINENNNNNKSECKCKEEIQNLNKRIVILEENENKYKKNINDIIQSKCKLVINTSAEMDALRYKIKMYTQGNWNEIIQK